jgi:hypothetical protein
MSLKATKAEKRNGWGDSELTAYIAQRNQAARLRIFREEIHGKQDVVVQNCWGKFHPHKWGARAK